jgi:hypothetical protein
MESVLGELRATADERLKKVSALETSINELIGKEKKLQEKIQGTEGLSKATVEAIAQVVGEKLEKAERPKRRRDYFNRRDTITLESIARAYLLNIE